MRRRKSSSGFGIIELMIAMTLSLLLLGGMVALFASSRKSYESTDHMARMQENGRFALDQIVRDIRSAGYLGCAKEVPFTNTLSTAANLMLWDFQFAVQGFDSIGDDWEPALDTLLVPSAAEVDSDVLVLRAPDPDIASKHVTTLMGTSSEDLEVAPKEPQYAAGNVLLVTDCTAVAVFEVTGYDDGTVEHETNSKETADVGGVASAGNTSADLGYAFTPGSMVTMLFSVASWPLAKPR